MRVACLGCALWLLLSGPVFAQVTAGSPQTTTTDTDDGSVASGQSVDLGIALMHWWNGSAWTRLTLGQATMANSMPVAIATNQSAVPANITQWNSVAVGNAVTTIATFGSVVAPVVNAALQVKDPDANTFSPAKELDTSPSASGSGTGILSTGLYAMRDDTSPTLANESAVLPVRMSRPRELYTIIRDAGANERGANVTANFELNVIATAQPGVDIGDVTLTNTDLDIQSGGADVLSTTAHDAAFGTAGTADAQVRTVQGVASMTPILTQPQAIATGGATPYPHISVGASEDEHPVCTAPCNIYSITVTNTNAAVRYLKCENDTQANTAPGTDTPEYRMAIPGATTGAGFTAAFPVGKFFSAALTCWLVTGAADSDVAEVAANEIMVNYDFKQ